jgi:hypothetical protein
MKAMLFMENMWGFFLCYYFVPYGVNISMYVGGFKQFQAKKKYLLVTRENSQFKPTRSENLQRCGFNPRLPSILRYSEI